MMKTLSIFTAILFLAVMFSSCDRTLEPDSSFIGGSNIELSVGGSVVYKYDPASWQLGYNSSKKEFRVFDDSMKNYYTVTCSSLPSSTGQKLEATVTWSSGSSIQTMKGKFEVAKVQGDTYWLWCGDKKTRTGVTVRILR
ncbi:MAG: hypothetical protein IKW89_00745 [Bacteroidales bacterium]|nr:hypothetical protein [Bacteroidales bacterium]